MDVNLVEAPCSRSRTALLSDPRSRAFTLAGTELLPEICLGKIPMFTLDYRGMSAKDSGSMLNLLHPLNNQFDATFLLLV